MKEKQRARGFWVSYGNGEGVVAVHICGKSHYLSNCIIFLKPRNSKGKCHVFGKQCISSTHN